MKIRKQKLLWQIFTSFLLITLIMLLCLTWFGSASFRSFHLQQTRKDLENSAWLIAPHVSLLLKEGQDVDRFCKSLQGTWTDNRLTVILRDGTVIGDSAYEIGSMERHDNRPEIRKASFGEVGFSSRFSNTLQQKMMYLAIPLSVDGERRAVVRLSRSLDAVEDALLSIELKIGLAWLVAGLIAAGVILNFSRKISRPFEKLKDQALHLLEGDPKDLPPSDSEELGGLSKALNALVSRLEKRSSTIDQQRLEMETILSSMSDAVLAVDTESRILKLNTTMATLFGIDSACRGAKVQEVIRNAEFNRCIENTLTSSEAVVTDLTLFNPDPRFLNVSGARLRDAEGLAIGAVLVLKDVTRLKKLEDHRKDFVANVSHELRTPITAIKGFVEILLEGALDNQADAKRFLDIISRQSERLGNIIEDLLQLSKIEQDQTAIKSLLANRNLEEDLARAIDLCHHKAATKRIELALSCPEKLILKLHPSLFQQAMVNLVDNAIKYSESDKCVRIAVHEDGDEVMVDVIDQGVGIPRTHLARLFERFYRVDKARSRDVGGTGLGLSIVKHIVSAHGGSVRVASEFQVGSTFTVCLPKVWEEAAPSMEQLMATPAE